jgi:F0F1-type ATP synthase assembly protein I
MVSFAARRRCRRHGNVPERKRRHPVADPFAAGVAGSTVCMGQAMAAPKGDKRPPLAVAMELASQITSVALLMALPAWAGNWGDEKLGTSPLLVIVGAVFGLAAGIAQVLRLADARTKNTGHKDRHVDESQR